LNDYLKHEKLLTTFKVSSGHEHREIFIVSSLNVLNKIIINLDGYAEQDYSSNYDRENITIRHQLALKEQELQIQKLKYELLVSRMK